MGAALEITLMTHTAAELRSIAGRCDDAPQVRRLLAIALVLDGRPRSEAADQNGMDRQTLRDWVHRYNAGGIAGLKSRAGAGRPAALTSSQMEELKALVIAGPDPALHGVVRWRCLDLRAEVTRRFAVTVNEGTVGKWLHQLGIARRVGRRRRATKESYRAPLARSSWVNTKGAWFGPSAAAAVPSQEGRRSADGF